MTSKGMVEWCKYAESKGFGYVFRSDHYLPIPTGVADSPECWTSLGAAAVITKAIRFGTMVTPTSYRNPALLGKMARTVNSLADGRLMFGLGAGWFEREYLAYGYPYPDAKSRIDQFEEALQIIMPMVNGERVSFKGKHYSAELEALPKVPTHFLIGGRHPRVIRDAARLADEWNIYACPIPKFKRCKKVLDSALDASGRHVVTSHTGVVMIAEDRRALLERVKNGLRKQGINGDPEAEIQGMVAGGNLCGTPAEVNEQIKERMELGVDRFYLEPAEMQTTEMADLLAATLKGL